MNVENWTETIEWLNHGLSYLDDLSKEYEIDNPGYVTNLQRFKQEKKQEIDELYESLGSIGYQLENYPEYVVKPNIEIY